MKFEHRLIHFYENLRFYGLEHRDAFELAEFAEKHIYDLDRQYLVDAFYVGVYLQMRRTMKILDAEKYAKQYTELVVTVAEQE